MTKIRTDHEATCFSVEVTPVGVRECLLQFRRRDSTRFVRVDRIKPTSYFRAHLRRSLLKRLCVRWRSSILGLTIAWLTWRSLNIKLNDVFETVNIKFNN